MAISSTDNISTSVVESPCIKLCTLDADDVCVGCYRNIAEICAWGSADSNQRRQIVAAASARREASRRCD